MQTTSLDLPVRAHTAPSEAIGSFDSALVFVGLSALSYLVIVKDINRVALHHRDA